MKICSSTFKISTVKVIADWLKRKTHSDISFAQSIWFWKSLTIRSYTLWETKFGYFGFRNLCDRKSFEDCLFVSRLNTVEVSVEARTGMVEKVRELTRGVWTNYVLAVSNINIFQCTSEL